MVMFNDLIFV